MQPTSAKINNLESNENHINKKIKEQLKKAQELSQK